MGVVFLLLGDDRLEIGVDLECHGKQCRCFLDVKFNNVLHFVLVCIDGACHGLGVLADDVITILLVGLDFLLRDAERDVQVHRGKRAHRE